MQRHPSTDKLQIVLTCALLDTDSGPLQVGSLGVDGGVVERVRGQAVETVSALGAPDGDLLSSTVAGLESRGLGHEKKRAEEKENKGKL